MKYPQNILKKLMKYAQNIPKISCEIPLRILKRMAERIPAERHTILKNPERCDYLITPVINRDVYLYT